MVHSNYAQGHVMGGRDIHSPLGIPKSPSFHSGLDLVASIGVEESLQKAFDEHQTTGFPGRISFYSGGNSGRSGAQTPNAVGAIGASFVIPVGTPGGSFGGSAESFGGRFGDSYGGSAGGAGGFAGSTGGNAFTMINGKTNVENIGGGSSGIGLMKNGIGMSSQNLAMQKNSTAVRSMQAMGNLPLLKGIY